MISDSHRAGFGLILLVALKVKQSFADKDEEWGHHLPEPQPEHGRRNVDETDAAVQIVVSHLTELTTLELLHLFIDTIYSPNK